MNMLELPWSPILLIIGILSLLFFREVLIAIRTPRFHPERKMAIFNGVVLVSLVIMVAFGANRLVVHESQFAKIFPHYPNARYAPEREILDKRDVWVYITSDSVEQVITFYRDRANQDGYTTKWNESTTSNRLMLQKGTETLFLTALSQNDTTVLYFSPEGEVITYQELNH